MRALSYVLLILGSITANLVVDLVLRPAGIAGTNPDAWDLVLTLVIVVGVVLLIVEGLEGRKD